MQILRQARQQIVSLRQFVVSGAWEPFMILLFPVPKIKQLRLRCRRRPIRSKQTLIEANGPEWSLLGLLGELIPSRQRSSYICTSCDEKYKGMIMGAMP